MIKLSERIASLTGPCRVIDAEIERVTTTGYGAIPTPSFTSSLDAITQLIEKDLEGGVWSASTDNLWKSAYVSWTREGTRNSISTTHANHGFVVIALCVCYVKAMEMSND